LQLSVVLIDEDLPSRNYLGALLARQGYSVKVAASGKEGYISVLRDRPEILILDTGLTDIPALELIKKLRGDKRSSKATFIALSSTTRKTQKNEMLSAGCSYFFLKTQASIEELMVLLADPDRLLSAGVLKKQRAEGRLCVFLGAKGGMGTSSMCVNIAHYIGAAAKEMDVAVMDMVLPIGSLDSIIGYRGDFDILKAVALAPAEMNKGALQRMLVPLDNWDFRFLAGFPDPVSIDSFDLTRLPGIVQAFRRVFDITLIDLGDSLSSENLSIIQKADVVVIVTGNDFTAIKLTKSIWQYLQQRQINLTNVYFLLNHSMRLAGLGKSDSEGLLGQPIRSVVPYLGEDLALANNQHLPITAKLAGDTVAMVLRQISQDILETARHNRL